MQEITLAPFTLFIAIVTILLIISVMTIWSKWVGGRNADKSPQKITLTTSETPAVVVAKASAARMRYRLSIFTLVGLSWLIFSSLRPEQTQPINSQLLQIAIGIIDLCIQFLNLLRQLLIQ